MHNTDVIEQTADLCHSHRALHRPGPQVHRPFQGIALLPLHAAHIPAHPAGGFRRGSAANRPRASTATWWKRSIGAWAKSCGAEAERPGPGHAGDVFERQRPVVPGEPRQASRSQEHDIRGRRPRAFHRPMAGPDSRGARFGRPGFHDGCLPHGGPAVRRGVAVQAAGWHRHMAAAPRGPPVHRAGAAALLRQLGFAVRALDELETAHRAAQHGRLHTGAARRAFQLSVAEAGVVQPGRRSG